MWRKNIFDLFALLRRFITSAFIGLPWNDLHMIAWYHSQRKHATSLVQNLNQRCWPLSVFGFALSFLELPRRECVLIVLLFFSTSMVGAFQVFLTWNELSWSHRVWISGCNTENWSHGWTSVRSSTRKKCVPTWQPLNWMPAKRKHLGFWRWYLVNLVDQVFLGPMMSVGSDVGWWNFSSKLC